MDHTRGTVPGSVNPPSAAAQAQNTEQSQETEEAAREQRRFFLRTFLKMVQLEYEQHLQEQDKRP